MVALVWTLLGLVIGVIAKSLHHKKVPGGWLIVLFVSVLGAFVGGWIGCEVGYGSVHELNTYNLILAVIGDLLLLGFFRFEMSR